MKLDATNRSSSTRITLGFTLIELLIVVAIIGILAAIAVPNFLRAQIRSKVARIYADQRSFATSFETYFVDWNNYPFERDGGCTYVQYLKGLTTPVAYMSNVKLPDPFMPPPSKFAKGCPDWIGSYHYVNYNGIWGQPYKIKAYVTMSYGPDKHQDGGEHFIQCWSHPNQCYSDTPIRGNPWNLVYNASNGLVSGGDVIRTGGDTRGAPLVAGG